MSITEAQAWRLNALTEETMRKRAEARAEELHAQVATLTAEAKRCADGWDKCGAELRTEKAAREAAEAEFEALQHATEQTGVDLAAARTRVAELETDNDRLDQQWHEADEKLEEEKQATAYLTEHNRVLLAQAAALRAKLERVREYARALPDGRQAVALLGLLDTPTPEPPALTIQHSALRDWFNALQEPFRGYVHWLDTNADPSGNIRDAVCWRENAMAMQARLKELENELAAGGPWVKHATYEALRVKLERAHAALTEARELLDDLWTRGMPADVAERYRAWLARAPGTPTPEPPALTEARELLEQWRDGYAWGKSSVPLHKTDTWLASYQAPEIKI